MLALLLSYMDQVCFMGRVMDRQFPLIKYWKRENIFNRRDLELKKAGEFGTGEVKPRLILNVGGQHVRYQQEIPTETIEHAKKACIEKVTQIAKELAKSFSEFVDAMDEAKMKFPDREPIVKLCDLASSIVQVFEDSEFKECTQRGEARTHCTDESPRLDENDEIFNDPSFLKNDGIATAVRKRKKVGSGDEEGVMHQQPTTIASEERPMKRKRSTIATPIRRSPRVVSNSDDNDSLAAPDVVHKGFVGVVIQEEK
ncbi:DNA-directed RNA polymerase subunit alpha [Bienertia sinuspersici]